LNIMIFFDILLHIHATPDRVKRVFAMTLPR